MNNYLALPVLVGLVVGIGPAHALDISAAADLSIEHTDNARKSTRTQISETQQNIGLTVIGGHGGERLTADFQYRADRRFYSEDSQNEETVLEGSAALRWEQISEALYWDLSHTRRDLLRDSALVDIRENRDERDITEISPVYIMRLSPVDSLQGSLRYSMVTYRSADNLDSNRYGGGLTWVRKLSPIDTVFVSVETDETDFDSALQDDYRYDTASVAYAAELARLSYRATLGYNRASRDLGDDVSGPLIAFNGTYDAGLHQWHVRFDSRITDSSLGEGNRDVFGSDDTTDTTLGDVDIFTKTRLDVGVTSRFLCSVCEVRATIFYDKEDYETQPRDNDEYGLQASLGYRLSAVSSLSGTYRIRSVAYDGNNPRSDFDQNEFLFEYMHQVWQDISATAFIGYVDRSTSSGSGFATEDYDETRFGIRLSYEFL